MKNEFRVRLQGTLTGNPGWSLVKAILAPFNLMHPQGCSNHHCWYGTPPIKL